MLTSVGDFFSEDYGAAWELRHRALADGRQLGTTNARAPTMPSAREAPNSIDAHKFLIVTPAD
jgi:hypothetical protein